MLLYTQTHSDGLLKKNTLVFIALHFYHWMYVLYYHEYSYKLLEGKYRFQTWNIWLHHIHGIYWICQMKFYRNICIVYTKYRCLYAIKDTWNKCFWNDIVMFLQITPINIFSVFDYIEILLHLIEKLFDW